MLSRRQPAACPCRIFPCQKGKCHAKRLTALMPLKRAIQHVASAPEETAGDALLMIAGTVGITLDDGLPEPGVIKRGAIERELNGIIIDGYRVATN